MSLDLLSLLQDGLGIGVGVDGPLIRRRAQHLLADHDDGEQGQLKERLRYPLDDRKRASVDRLGQRDESECREGVGAPHGADAFGDKPGKPAVESALVLLLDLRRTLPLPGGDTRMRRVFEKTHGGTLSRG